MSWENIIKRERTELSTLVGEVSDLAIELHILVPLDKESESNPILRKIEEKLKKIHDLEMARFWAEQNRRE